MATFPERFMEAALCRLPPEIFGEIYQMADHQLPDREEPEASIGITPAHFRQRGLSISRRGLSILMDRLRAAHFSGQKIHDGIELERRQTHEITAFRLVYGGKKLRVRYDVTSGVIYSLALANRPRVERRYNEALPEERPTRQKLKMETRREAELALCGEE